MSGPVRFVLSSFVMYWGFRFLKFIMTVSPFPETLPIGGLACERCASTAVRLSTVLCDALQAIGEVMA